MCVNAIQMDGGSEFSAEFEQACQEGHRPLRAPAQPTQIDGAVERCNGVWRDEFYQTYELPRLLRSARSSLCHSRKSYPRAAMMRSCQNPRSDSGPMSLAPINRAGHPSPTIDAKSALAVRERQGARGLARLNRFWYFARGTGDNSRGLSQISSEVRLVHF
jgi:hypothetical protein